MRRFDVSLNFREVEETPQDREQIVAALRAMATVIEMGAGFRYGELLIVSDAPLMKSSHWFMKEEE